MNTKSWKTTLLEIIEEVDAAEQQALDAAIAADLIVDRTSGHWLPVPLTPALIRRIDAWLSPRTAAAAAPGGLRFAGPGGRLIAPSAAERPPTAPSTADTLEALLAPPAQGLEEARFHWLPVLLRPDPDGECTDLVLQAKDPESPIPIPIVMAVLDGEVMLPVDEAWDYLAETGRLELRLEGVVPERYTLDLSRSDQGKVVLLITSGGRAEETAPGSEAPAQ
jgi:hypothetical protein